MRDAFVRALTRLAIKDHNVILITGDLGFGVLTKFAEDYPEQYLNAGIAEQNMTGLAAGMALEGKVVFTYSIANFPTLRCLEQIRNDACYHNANVKVVAVGGGFAYGSLGISHHATEDLAIMRALPGMTVVAPGDPNEAEAATEQIYSTPGTCYLRLGRGGEALVHPRIFDFKVGKALRVVEGKDIVLISTGGVLKEAADACNKLCIMGYDAGLISMHTLKPLDEQCIMQVARSARLVITVEEHSVIGGLGGAVAEVVAQLPLSKAVLRMVGLRAGFSSVVGDQEYLRAQYGIDSDAIVRTAVEANWIGYAKLERKKIKSYKKIGASDQARGRSM